MGGVWVKSKNFHIDKKGTSMLFALLLFILLLVLGINLLNAVYADTVNTQEEMKKEQTLFYISSAFEVVNEMITRGAFYDDTSGKVSEKATTVFHTDDGDLNVDVVLKQKTSSLSAKIIMKYDGTDYEINCYYKKSGASGLYSLERCSGLENKDV